MIDLRGKANIADVIFEIQSTGKYRGRNAKSFRILGKRSAFTSTTAFNDIGEGIGTAAVADFPVLSGAETIQVISTSASDDGWPAGTGVRTIKVVYIDTNYEIQETSPITMNGLTAVTVMAGGMLEPLWFESATVGSGSVAAGTITLRTSAPLTLSQITAGGNKSMDAKFFVPDGYTAYVTDWDGGAIANIQDVRLRAFTESYSRDTGSVYLFQDNMYLPAGTSRPKDLPWLKFEPRSWIKISTISSSTSVNTRCDAGFTVVIIQD